MKAMEPEKTHTSPPRRWYLRWRWVAVWALVLVGLLAVASYWTTSMAWDGGFPSGEFRLNIRDAAGNPVPGATLHVYSAATRELAFEYPLDNHIPGNDLASDSKGQIVAIRKHGGLQFGGGYWRLFWIIPVGKTGGPKYDCAITATGYKRCTFEVRHLFRTQYRHYDEFPKTKLKLDGDELELKVYEHTFVLERH